MGVTELSRLSTPRKAIAMAIYPVIVHFTTQCACLMHDIVCEFRAQ